MRTDETIAVSTEATGVTPVDLPSLTRQARAAIPRLLHNDSRFNIVSDGLGDPFNVTQT